MNAPTITEQSSAACPRCAGAGRLAQFSHIKGGECYACHGTGSRAVTITRPMVADEIAAALAALGLPIMPEETTKPATGDWFQDMMPTEAEQAKAQAAGEGAALALSVIHAISP